jgi:polyisoprenoid-binding protein YceI
MNKWIKWAIVAVVAVVVLGAGAVFVYTQFLSDSDPELTTEDLSEIVSGTDAPVDADAPADTEAPVDTEAPAATETPDPGGVEVDFDGTWVATSDSLFGYRVEEEITGVAVTATGRSNEIDGTLEIEGTTASVSVTVLVENITSDDSRRDSAFRGRIMEAGDFPEATFVSTEPIEFGEIPSDGEQVTVPITGDVTLKDVTNNVTFEATAEIDGDRIGVLGNIPVVFADYGIDNPSFGPVSTDDEGLIEFILVFEPA